MIKLTVVEDYEAVSDLACRVIAHEIEAYPDLVLLAATGDTPMGTYRGLARMAQAGAVDVSQITVAQLDEYVGIGPDDRRSLRRWMNEAVVEPLRVAPSRVLSFALDGADLASACQEYGGRLLARGVGLAVLGLGPNGHLGFNEPPAAAYAPTRLVSLSPESIVSNSRYWGTASDVPPRAVTVGMDVILASRKILLVVSGSHKVDILRRTLTGEITPDVPASLLRSAPDVLVVADREAWPSHEADQLRRAGVELAEQR